MRSRPFEQLQAMLLSRGVPRSRVRRVTVELADHLACLCSEFEANGLNPDDAAENAARRLGGDEFLAAQYLARPGLVPYSRRRPKLTFLAWPIPVALAALGVYGVLGVLLMNTAAGLLGLRSIDPAFGWLAKAVFAPAAYGLTGIVAAGFCALAHRRGCALRWPLIACLLIAAFGTMLIMGYRLPENLPGQTSQGVLHVGFGSALNWPRLAIPLLVFAAFAWKELNRRGAEAQRS